MSNPIKKDRDEITVARSIFDEIVECTESNSTAHKPTPNESRARKGGLARSEKLTRAERRAIAKRAAAARWNKA